jgi:hypothetical protein
MTSQSDLRSLRQPTVMGELIGLALSLVAGVMMGGVWIVATAIARAKADDAQRRSLSLCGQFRGYKLLIDRVVPKPNIIDAFKNAIQYSVSKPIVWWPLSEPQTPLPQDLARLTWFCVNHLARC